MTKIPGLCYSSPTKFRPRQKLALALIPPFTAMLLKTWFALCHWETRGEEHWVRAGENHGKTLIAFWHEALAMALFHYRNTGFHTLTSLSYDGELAARLVERCGLHALRGSSSRGGSEALRGMAAALQHVDSVGFTLDGPRGPRRIAKPGIALLALRTRTPVIPHAFAVQPAWHLKSWDRMPIPKPFARVVSAYGPAIPPPDDTSHEAIEAFRVQVQDALNALQDGLERDLTGPEG